MKPEKLNYPVKTKFIRWVLVNNFELCPDCGNQLDSGWECTKYRECGFDAQPLVGTIKEILYT